MDGRAQHASQHRKAGGEEMVPALVGDLVGWEWD